MVLDGKDLDGEKTTTKDGEDTPLLEKGREPSPSGGDESSPSIDAPKYTEAQLAEIVKTRHSLLDKEITSLKKTNETLTSKLAEKETAITENASEIEKVRAELEDMAKESPDTDKYVKKLKVLEEREAELAKHLPSIEKAKKAERNTLMGEIAGEHQDGDTEILIQRCDDLGIPDDPDEIDPAKVRVIAGMLWRKIETGKEPQKKEPPEPPSGLNKGGRESLEGKSIKELFNMAFSKSTQG